LERGCRGAVTGGVGSTRVCLNVKWNKDWHRGPTHTQLSSACHEVCIMQFGYPRGRVFTLCEPSVTWLAEGLCVQLCPCLTGFVHPDLSGLLSRSGAERAFRPQARGVRRRRKASGSLSLGRTSATSLWRRAGLPSSRCKYLSRVVVASLLRPRPVAAFPDRLNAFCLGLRAGRGSGTAVLTAPLRLVGRVLGRS
jgi:hypothetical protein